MKSFEFINKIVFRAPAYPFSHLKSEITFKEFSEMLYLASPTLTQELDKLEKNQIKEEKEKKKIKESVYKYHSRASSRCTPFGLFAGVGTGNWGEETNIVLKDTKRRETRLDMNYVCSLGQFISNIKEIQENVLFFPNNSIYKVADKIRYVDYKFVNNKRSHQISEVDNSEYLEKILALAQKGAYIKDMAQCIVDDEVSFDEAYEFVKEIIGAQLLKNELEPNVTGENYFDILLRKLIELSKTRLKADTNLSNIINFLMEVDKKVKQIDTHFFNKVEDYKAIGDILKQIPVKFEENNLFQTDLYLNTESATLDQKFQETLIQLFEVLNKFAAKPKETRLTKFAEEFYKRYEDEELPLMYALDTELGTGYAGNKGSDSNPLIEGLAFQTGGSSSNSLNYTNLDLLLHTKLRQAYAEKATTVELTTDDFKNITSPPTNDLPATFTASFSLISKEKYYLNFMGGMCAANMLGRFAAGPQDIRAICDEIIAHENEFFSDKIIAEIVHLPESRTGNILMRPSFRKYEIPYLANPSVSNEFVVEMSDLYVSAKGGRVILRSKKLGKEILPRLTNAHNYSFNALPIYQFLCDLQSQNIRSGFGFHWGAFATLYQFKPRAVLNSVIVKEATWDLKKDDVQELVEKPYNIEFVKQFRDKWMLPERVLLTDNDNTLLVDFTNELSTTTFLAAIKKRSSFTLTEHLFDETNPAIINKKGDAYENEFLAFIKNTEKPVLAQRKIEKNESKVKRYFPIGSEWMYYKIYTGAKTSDRVIAECLKPIADELLSKGVIDKWFFIRYSDPEKHVRVRFHIIDINKYGELVNTISAKLNTLLDDKLAWKIQTDTYERELERYGYNSIDLCESYFQKDSEFVAKFLNSIEGEEGEKLRWVAGFRCTDDLLTSFGLDLDTKKKFMQILADNFGREHGMGKGLRVTLDNKFRHLRKEIELHMNKQKDEESDYKSIWDILEEKNTEVKSIVDAILKLKNEGNLDTNFDELLSSLIHMMLNRLFKSQQRKHELVVYDLLHNYYTSMIARLKKPQPIVDK